MEDLCSQLEANNGASIERVEIQFFVTGADQYALISSYRGVRGPMALAKHHLSLSRCEIWERLGQALEQNKTVRELILNSVALEDGVELSHEAHRSMQMLFGRVKNNKKIEKLKIRDICSDDLRFSRFDLVHFAGNNRNLREFIIEGGESLTHDQSVLILNVLENSRLKKFDMHGVTFGLSNDSDFRRIVLGCRYVKELAVSCRTVSQFATVAALLENPSSALNELSLYGELTHGAMSKITTSLENNKKLTTLIIGPINEDVASIARLLCDVSNLTNIKQSNHFLAKILMNFGSVRSGIVYEQEPDPFTPLIRDCLKINKHPNKVKVIRKKIARYYFVGAFDTSPFAKLPLSVLPEVIETIEGDKQYRQNAIFRLVQSIPGICDDTVRSNAHNVDDEVNDRKRQKIRI